MDLNFKLLSSTLMLWKSSQGLRFYFYNGNFDALKASIEIELDALKASIEIELDA